MKIVGLAMMVSPDFRVPLFHEVYPGNDPDAKQFSQVIDKLKNRYQAVCGEPKKITLVFDKGNNSTENIKHLRSGDWGFHVIGTLKHSQVKPLLDIKPSKFESLSGERFEGMTVYRTTHPVYDEQMTVLVTYNPLLLEGQMQGIQKNIETCTQQLKDLQHKLSEREAGRIRKGKKPTVSSVQKRVNKILSKEYMKDMFEIDVSPLERSVQLAYTFNESHLEYLKTYILGKTILYTDNHGWSNEKIVAAYRSQSEIESSFKQMKDHDHLDVRPIYHWTDQKIKVHAFYCVLALRLCCLLNRELHDHGIDMSVNRMLDVLADIKQVINVYENKEENKKTQKTFALSRYTPEMKAIMETLDLEKYQLEG